MAEAKRAEHKTAKRMGLSCGHVWYGYLGSRCPECGGVSSEAIMVGADEAGAIYEYFEHAETCLCHRCVRKREGEMRWTSKSG